MLPDARVPAQAVPEGQEVTTWKSASPPGPPAGATNVHVVLFAQVMGPTVVETNALGTETVNNVVAPGTCLKPVPVTVIVFPPAAGPVGGLTEVIVGVAGVVPYRK